VGGVKEKMEKAECSENIVYCVKMEKLDLLKLFQE
jgi:hypothetical protein